MSASRRMRGAVLLPLFLAVALAACGGGTASSQDRPARQSAARQYGIETRLAALERLSTHERRIAYLGRARRAVIRGAATDFSHSTGIGGRPFEACVRGLLWEALDGPTIANLVAVYRRPFGTAYAAQALNTLAAPLAADCGHRSWVPELVEAARGLRNAAPIGAAREKLGVTYGPYLGKRCRHTGYRGCELIGIDIVFAHAATRVVAIAGHQQISLRTPGKHNGIRYRDWVGNFTHAGLSRRGPDRRATDLVYVGVEIRVHFANGRRAHAFFPHVLVSSGWG
jgi:hypothetical protein